MAESSICCTCFDATDTAMSPSVTLASTLFSASATQNPITPASSLFSLGLSTPLAQRAFGAPPVQNSFLGVFSALLQDHSGQGSAKAQPAPAVVGTLPKKKLGLPGADNAADTELIAQSVAAVQVAPIQALHPSPSNVATCVEHTNHNTSLPDRPVAPIGEKQSELQQSGTRGFVPSVVPANSAAKSTIVIENLGKPHEQVPATESKIQANKESPLSAPAPLAFPSSPAVTSSSTGLDKPIPDATRVSTAHVDSFRQNVEYLEAPKTSAGLTLPSDSSPQQGELAKSPNEPENLKQDIDVKPAVGDSAPVRGQPQTSNPSKLSSSLQTPETPDPGETTAQLRDYAKTVSAVLSPVDRVKVVVDAPKTNLKEEVEPNIVKDLKDDSPHRSAVRSADAPAANGAKDNGQVNQPSLFQAREHEPVFEQIAAKIIGNSGLKGSDRETELHVRLSPPELGGVQVHLTASAQGVSARLVVDQEMTKQLLENHAGSLKQRLSESGIQLGSFHVSRHPWGRGGDRHRGDEKAPDLSDPTDEMDPVKSAGQARAVAALSARMGSINVLA